MIITIFDKQKQQKCVNQNCQSLRYYFIQIFYPARIIFLLIETSLYKFKGKMSTLKSNSKQPRQLMKLPPAILPSIIRFSSTFNQREVDNYYNLVSDRTSTNLCQLCLQAYSEGQIGIVPQCQHTFCYECMHNYLLYKIEVGQQIRCPIGSCRSHIQEQQIWYKQLPRKSRDRHEQLKMYRQQNSAGKNSAYMPCSVDQCQGIVNFKEQVPKCSKCSQEYCKSCHLSSHKDTCQADYGQHFSQWRCCPSCSRFNIKMPNSNKMNCQCKLKFCAICLEEWSQLHVNCQQQINEILEDIYCKNCVICCCPCWNIFSAVLYIFLLPFILAFVTMMMVGALLMSVIGGFLCSCCYSRTEGYALWASILFCPCLGCCSIGHALKDFFGETVIASCRCIAKYGRTIKALCCFQGVSNEQEDKQSNKLEF